MVAIKPIAQNSIWIFASTLSNRALNLDSMPSIRELRAVSMLSIRALREVFIRSNRYRTFSISLSTFKSIRPATAWRCSSGKVPTHKQVCCLTAAYETEAVCQLMWFYYISSLVKGITLLTNQKKICKIIKPLISYLHCNHSRLWWRHTLP